jgi:hypothetical protein
MSRANRILSAIAVGMFLMPAAMPDLARNITGMGSASAQPAAANTKTTVPDDTFGAGGTKESLANDKHELIAETWRDKNGFIRERFEFGDEGVQIWGFFQGEGQGTSEWGGTIAVKPMPRPAGRWDMTIYGPGFVTLKEYSFLSRDELDKEFGYWHRQMRNWVNGFLNPRAPGNG